MCQSPYITSWPRGCLSPSCSQRSLSAHHTYWIECRRPSARLHSAYRFVQVSISQPCYSTSQVGAVSIKMEISVSSLRWLCCYQICWYGLPFFSAQHRQHESLRTSEFSARKIGNLNPTQDRMRNWPPNSAQEPTRGRYAGPPAEPAKESSERHGVTPFAHASKSTAANGVPRRLRHRSPLAAQCEALGGRNVTYDMYPLHGSRQSQPAHHQGPNPESTCHAQTKLTPPSGEG